MKKTKVLLILAIILCSCTSNKKDPTTIELMYYNLRYNYEREPLGDAKMTLYWGIYSYIDDSGNAYVCYSNYDEKNERHYIKMLLDIQKIEKVIEASKKYSKTDYDIKNQTPGLYDGPSYKMRINYDDKSSKTINFTESGSFNQDVPFVDFYEYIWLRCRNDKHDFLTDTSDIALKVDKFIEFIFNDNKSSFCPPPPPPEVLEQKVKFSKPKHKKVK